jgi:hypothetical protein
MKKYIVLMLLIMLSVMRVEAQSDTFFKYHDEQHRDNNEEWKELVLLPKVHGLDYNYPADDAPISSGALLMLKMGILYGLMKKRENTDTR